MNNEISLQQFPSRPRLELFFKWLMFTAAISAMALLSTYYPIWGNIPLIVIPSILTLLFAKPVFFEKIKLFTLVTMRTLIVFAVLFDFGQIYSDIIMIMMIINILEATLTDFKHKQYFNFVSGIFLALGVLAMTPAWGANAGGPGAGMDYYFVDGVNKTATICWVVAYTIWNWIFVTGEFSASVSLLHTGFLSAPMLLCLITMPSVGFAGGFGLWYLVRANTLSIGGYMQICCKNWFETQFYSPRFEKFVAWTHKWYVQLVLMIVCLALIGYTLVGGIMTNGLVNGWFN